jgi:hypothetical protein
MCALVLGFLDAILILLYLVHQIRFDGDLILFHRVHGVSSIPFFDYSVRRISLSDKFEALRSTQRRVHRTSLDTQLQIRVMRMTTSF